MNEWVKKNFKPEIIQCINIKNDKTCYKFANSPKILYNFTSGK